MKLFHVVKVNNMLAEGASDDDIIAALSRYYSAEEVRKFLPKKTVTKKKVSKKKVEKPVEEPVEDSDDFLD